MNMPHRFVSDLSTDEITAPNEPVKNHPFYRVRRRAHAVLLSYEQFGTAETASVCKVSRNPLSSWLKAWEKEGIAGLYDLPRSGAPPKLTRPESDRNRMEICITIPAADFGISFI
jgi:hypothetical protein